MLPMKVKSFVPSFLVDIVNDGAARGRDFVDPQSIFFTAVCLVVDISGFTKLSGEYCGLGKAGIDLLQLATNGYMGQLVEVVHEFSGDVIKFAGDALICVFPCTAPKRRRSNVIPCIQRLQSNVSAFSGLISQDESSQDYFPAEPTTPGTRAPLPEVTASVVFRALLCAEKLRLIENERLSVHVGISCGEMCFGVLGGFENRWECLVSGSCIQEISACLDDAAKNEIVITRDCAEIILSGSKDSLPIGVTVSTDASIDLGRCQCFLSRKESGNFVVVNATTDNSLRRTQSATLFPAAAATEERYLDDAILPFLHRFAPAPVAKDLEAGRDIRGVAEIREVTTMFMKWESYDAQGKHRDLLTLQMQFYEVQKVLHATGAYLRQFLVDDKGCVLIACWGMPNLSYLDNAHRALSAAAQIRCKLMAMDMACSFGITTGDVYCGTVGSALRMEYAAIGSVVNMSARLMCKAHGGILIDATTWDRLPIFARRTLEELPPLKVKGREEPLQVFSYIATDFVHVREKVVEDHAIPKVKRDTMMQILTKMAESNERPRLAQLKAKPATVSGSWWRMSQLSWRHRNRPADEEAESEEHPLQVLLIKGVNGSGKTSVVKWLRRKAQNLELPVHCVRVSASDCHTNMYVWRCVFHLMAPRDLFLSAETQRTYVHELLKAVFPSSSRGDRRAKFAILQPLLGITCSYSRKKGSGGIRGALWFSHALSSQKADAAPPAHVVVETVTAVMAHLLREITALVIVENIEHADEGSLQVLCNLLKLNTRSAVVLTALKNVATDTETSARLPQIRTRALQQSALQETHWTKKYKCILQCHRFTQTIFLEPYRDCEIARMLAAALNMEKTNTVPPSLVQLVQDYSGGSCFWVLEIVQYITEHGVDSFLASTSVPNTPSAKLSSLRTNSADERSLRPGTKTPSGSFRTGGVSTNRRNSSPETSTQVAVGLQQVQLDKLVLCRLGNLSPEVQRILRTASVVGATFTYAALNAVLAGSQRVALADKLQELVDLRWLYPDLVEHGVYHFSHAHTHGLVYELTPSSERSALHYQVAKYIEENCGEDAAQCVALCYHYQHCDTAKALLCAGKAIETLVRDAKTIFDFVECVEMLSGCAHCCNTSADEALLKNMITQVQVAIVMFCMNDELAQRNSFASALRKKTLYRHWWICGSSAVVPDPFAHDHHHDHDHEHEHEHAESKFGRCPCKMEEAADAAAERSVHGSSDTQSDDAPEHEGHMSQTMRVKRTLLKQLDMLAAPLKDHVLEATGVSSPTNCQ